MRKKYIIPIVCCLILIIGFTGYIIWNNATLSTITLDINPSIEINLNRKEKVKSIIALNGDAKEIINNNLKGKSLYDTLNIIVENLIDKDYVNSNDLVDVVLYSKGNISNENLENILSRLLGDRNIPVNIITVENITKEDKELAKKYNISPAKVAYIKTITKDKENINISDLANKSVSEIKETKETGRYCEEGWTLEGDFCLKEKERIKASSGKVCPKEYYEVGGKCYHEEEGEVSNELTCPNGFILKDNNCVSNEEIEPNIEYTCSKGELITDPRGLKPGTKTPTCVDKSTGKAPTQRCLTINHTMIDGKCADGPKPTINGGCEAGDYLIGGGCYTIDNEDQWVCTDGGIYEKSKGTYTDLCPETLTYIEPTVSKLICPNGFTLKDSKCVREDTIDAFYKKVCPSKYTLLDEGRCINYEKTVSKEDGFVCAVENSRLKGNICIIYEIIEAKHN